MLNFKLPSPVLLQNVSVLQFKLYTRRPTLWLLLLSSFFLLKHILFLLPLLFLLYFLTFLSQMFPFVNSPQVRLVASWIVMLVLLPW